MQTTPLPPFTETGEPGDWDFTDKYGSSARLKGDFLGMGSSRDGRLAHIHQFPPHAKRGQHCSACRWMEVRIFQHEDHRYLIVQTARSVVPGERDLTILGWAMNASELIAALISREPSGKPSLSFVARQALETASDYDDELDVVYRAALERVVT